MSTALTFKEHEIVPFDNKDGKIWFTGEHLAELLGYKDSKKVANLYSRHKDEFTESMSTIAKVRTSEESIGYEHLMSDIRLYSLRGAYLIGMFSRTKVAKELRIWLLDLAEKESNIDIGTLDIAAMTQLAGQKMHDLIDVFNKASLKHRGQKGSGLMAQRKRDIKKIKEATKLALELTQFSIPDLGDFPDEEGGPA
ncbi:BRO-N domain-containing protein [Xenorhabdus griffiniae]|uniref:BRO family protein n=1 Tax=Xenorhabdus griffiniae TaxID=351672 RepID=A0ABY9XFH8_9GAMM|nr:BRO family protein [Xenorhabdus griffiniae]WMV71671.1 BRO family protein [Xenorhabdus griffiniae]WNH01348.1 BRO family protein [Xenorhabdus griffiniae]